MYGWVPVPALSLEEIQAWLDANAYPVHEDGRQPSLLAMMQG